MLDDIPTSLNSCSMLTQVTSQNTVSASPQSLGCLALVPLGEAKHVKYLLACAHSSNAQTSGKSSTSKFPGDL